MADGLRILLRTIMDVVHDMPRNSRQMNESIWNILEQLFDFLLPYIQERRLPERSPRDDDDDEVDTDEPPRKRRRDGDTLFIINVVDSTT